MAIYRVNKNRNYTVMSNYHLRDTTLSMEAKGLLSIMFSLPEDWDYSAEGLASISANGRDSARHTLKELEEHGYLVRNRRKNENGRFAGYDYDVYEVPYNGEVVDSDTEDTKQAKEPKKPTAEPKEKTKRFTPPTVEDVTEYCKSRGNNVDPVSFHAFYSSKGWKVGKNPMKDWKSAVITWERNSRQRGRNNSYTDTRYDYNDLNGYI